MTITKLNAIDHNVYEGCKLEDGTAKRVQANTATDVYNYFFRHVLIGNHGCVQAMVNFFFQRLFEECITQGIPPVWPDDDPNGKRIVEILNRLNFEDNGQSVIP
jgi:hypothetical protein